MCVLVRVRVGVRVGVRARARPRDRVRVGVPVGRVCVLVDHLAPQQLLVHSGRLRTGMGK